MSGHLGQFVIDLENNRIPVANSPYEPLAVVSTIANAAAIGPALDTLGYCIEEILVPAAGWSGSNISIDKSLDGTNWAALYDKSGVEYLVTVGALSADRFVHIPPGELDGARYIRLRSGTHASPQNCTGSGCAIQVVMRRL